MKRNEKEEMDKNQRRVKSVKEKMQKLDNHANPKEMVEDHSIF